MHGTTVGGGIIYIYSLKVHLVFKKEFHTLGSKALIAFQAKYRAIEITEKDSKTSYTDTLLFILFSFNYWIFRLQDRQGWYIKYTTTFMTDHLSSECLYTTTFMTDYLSSKCLYINYVFIL